MKMKLPFFHRSNATLVALNSMHITRKYRRSSYQLLLCIWAVFSLSCNSQSSVYQDLENTNEEIPIVYRSHIYLKGTIGSTEGNFVFDTGADNLYYDSSFFTSNGFAYKNLIETTLGGAGNSTQNVIVVMDTVTINFGEQVYSTSIVPVLKLKPILGDFPDGIIGLDYFSKSVMEIDYKAEYMKLHVSIDSLNVKGYQKIKLERVANRLYMPVEIAINNSTTIKGKVLIDLGSGSGLSITSPTAKAYDLDNMISDKVSYFNKYQGVGGGSASYDFRAQSVRINDFVVKDVISNYSKDTTGSLSSTEHIGLLGNKILDRFDLILDFMKNDLYLRPNTDFDKPFPSSRLGFYYVDRSASMKSWIVTGLHESSNADRAGLQVDDEILSVNGRDVNTIPYQDQRSFLENENELTLTLRRGDEMLSMGFLLISQLGCK